MISTSPTFPSTKLTLLRPLLWVLLAVCNFSRVSSYIAISRLSATSKGVTLPTPHPCLSPPSYWLQQQRDMQQQRQPRRRRCHPFFTTTTTTRLYDNASFGPWRDSLDDSNHPDDFDVEAARERLESLVLDTGGGEPSSSSGGPPETTSSSSSASRLQQQPSSSSQSPFSFTSMEQQQQQHDDDDDIFPFPLPRHRRTVLTSIERERRQAEIQLLSRLADGDDVLVEIWALWFQERGPQAAARLVQAEELMTMTTTTPSTQQQQQQSTSSSSSSSTNNNNSPEQQVRFRFAEQVLLELIQEYGLDWSEPINRLATLYYMTGRFSQAVRACQLVLENKPWHFGTLSGIVMVYASLQDSHHARHFAAHRLPTFASIGPNRRRQLWVETAMAHAQQSLLDAERRAQAALGEPDAHAPRPGQGNMQKKTMDQKDDGDDAWQ